MLSVSRSEIVGFLDSLGQPYVTDSSNLVPDVKRNKIRLQLMPLLQQLNPNVAQSIFETSLRVGEAVNVYDDAMGRAVAEVVDNVPDAARLDGAAGAEVSVETPVSVSIPRLLAQVSPESVLFSILSPCGFTSSQVEPWRVSRTAPVCSPPVPTSFASIATVFSSSLSAMESTLLASVSPNAGTIRLPRI